MSIRGVTLNWLRSYLVGRRQKKFKVYSAVHYSTYTVVDKRWGSHMSMIIEWIETYTQHWVRHGDPQGSVLGPILFLIYVYDLPFCVGNAHVCIYADDTSLSFSNHNRELLEIQTCLECFKVLSWLSENKPKPNVAKNSVSWILNREKK